MSDLSFEQAREELATLVAALEAGGLSLEESLALWKRGEEVATVCTQWLDHAKETLASALESGPGTQGDA